MRCSSLTFYICCSLALISACSSSDRNRAGTESTVPEFRLIRLHYENASGEKGLTTFDYNRDGNPGTAIWELLDGSRNSLNFLSYNKAGKLIKKYREFSDSLTSTQLYEYNEQCQLIKESYQRSDGRTGMTNYEYDDSGHLSIADCQGLNGWFFGRITYHYDETGKKLSATIDQKGVPAGSISYTYDDHGNLIREYWNFSAGWSQTFIYEYEEMPQQPPKFYRSSNVYISQQNKYRLIREAYDYSNKIGGPSYYHYDETGKLTNKRFERSDGLWTETNFLYNTHGFLTKSYRKYSNGMTAVFTYFFDNNGNLTNRTFVRTDGARGSEFYEYDKNSKLIHAALINFDAWLNGTISYKHDQDGNLKVGYFKSTSGPGAKIYFSYDKHRNLTKVHWDFNLNITQTYIFEYERF